MTRPGELLPVEAACERLEAARTAAPAGSFVLNARTDAYMIRHPDAFADVRVKPVFLDDGLDLLPIRSLRRPQRSGR